MNQNQLGNLFLPQKRKKKNASYFRAQARSFLGKGSWGEAIFAGFVAMLLGATVMGGVNIDIVSFLSTVMSERSMPTWVPAAIAGGVVLLMIFVASPIKLGHQMFHLDIIEEERPSAKGIFSYFGICYWKSVLLNVIYLCISVLPFVLIYIASAIHMSGAVEAISQVSRDAAGKQVTTLVPTTEFWITLCIVLALCAVSFVWSCIASYIYRYSFAVLAEYPEVGVIEAMRMSRTMMKGRKWKLFCLDVSFVGWLLLGLYTCGFGLLFVIPYRETALIAFYDEAANRSSAKDVEFPSLDPNDYKA